MNKNIYIALVLLFFLRAGSGQSLADFFFQDAVMFFQQGDYENAYINFERYAETGEKTRDYYLYFASTCLQLGMDNVVSVLREGLEKYPKDTDMSFILLQLLANDKQFEEALNILETIKNAIPKEQYAQYKSMLAFNIGIKLFNDEKIEESEYWFKTARKYDPDEPAFIRNDAIVLWKIGKKEEAIALLEESLPLFPTDDDMNKLLIGFYEKKHDIPALKDKLEKRAARTGKIEDYLVLGKFYLKIMDLPNSKKTFGFLEKKYSGNPDVYIIQIQFWQKTGKYERADSVAERMVRALPDDTLSYVYRAENYEKMDSLRKANEVWNKCLAVNPGNTKWHYRILNNLQKIDNDKYRNYLLNYKKYAINGKDFIRIGKRLYDLKEYTHSLYCFQTALNMGYDESLVYLYIGKNFLQTGEKIKAGQSLEKAISLNEPEPEAYFLLVKMLPPDSVKRSVYLDVGMEVLLAEIRAVQEKGMKELKKGIKADKRIQLVKSYPEFNTDYSKLLEEEIRWIMNNFNSEFVFGFVDKMLNRFPKNHFLRLKLAELHLENKDYNIALKYFDEVLFIKPGLPEALEKKIAILEKLDRKEELYKTYLMLFYKSRKSMDDYKYEKLISLARKTGQIKNLCRQWMAVYERKKEDALLKKHLIEALHLSGNHKKAREVAADKPGHAKKEKKDLLPIKTGRKIN